MVVYRELPDRSNNDSYLGMEPLKSSKPTLASPVTARLLVFMATMSAGLLVSKATMEGERRCE